MTSNGNSTRQSGQLQLRRRLHNGLTATLQYVYSKSIDDSSLGGRSCGGSAGGTGPVASNAGTASGVLSRAQNWLDLSAERALIQLRSAAPAHGHRPIHHRPGHLRRNAAERMARHALQRVDRYDGHQRGQRLAANSDLSRLPCPEPDSPVSGPTIPARRSTTLRPGLTLNPAAYAAPVGTWGNAGRNSITGPTQFTMNASLGRTFRLKDRYSLDLRVDSTNPINHVTYTTWNTIILSPQFGTAAGANPMRSLQTTLRLRF